MELAMESTSKMCRICLNNIKNDCPKFDLSSVEGNQDFFSIGLKLGACVPEMNLNITADPVFCENCFFAIQFCYKFKEKCLEAETRIQKYLQRNNVDLPVVNLQDVVNQEKKLKRRSKKTFKLDVIDSESVIFNSFPDNSLVGNVKEEVDTNLSESSKKEKKGKHRSKSASKMKTETVKLKTPAISESEPPDFPTLCKKFKPFQCLNCPFSSNTKGNLKMHLLVHNKEKKFKCVECNYQCVQKQHLVVHMRRHTGEKPYGCPQCSYRCRQPTNLKAHMNQHFIVKLMREQRNQSV